MPYSLPYRGGLASSCRRYYISVITILVVFFLFLSSKLPKGFAPKEFVAFWGSRGDKWRDVITITPSAMPRSLLSTIAKIARRLVQSPCLSFRKISFCCCGGRRNNRERHKGLLDKNNNLFCNKIRKPTGTTAFRFSDSEPEMQCVQHLFLLKDSIYTKWQAPPGVPGGGGACGMEVWEDSSMEVNASSG